MRNIYLVFIFIGLFSLFILSCQDDNELTRLSDMGTRGSVLSSSVSFVSVCLDSTTCWQTSSFGTCYVKIPSYEGTEWFDIVLTSTPKQIATSHYINNKYLFIHANSPILKSFSYDSIIRITDGLKVIYYEGKRVEQGSATYRRYLTNPKGVLSIFSNNGYHMSGEFDGVLYDVYEKQTHNIRIMFHKIPISIIQ
ncbi:MAG: hypothetical protein ACTTJH_05895 [Bacteroidales bacterium]